MSPQTVRILLAPAMLRVSCAASINFSSVLALSTNRTPCSASRQATDLPIPELAPEMTAIRSFIKFIFSGICSQAFNGVGQCRCNTLIAYCQQGDQQGARGGNGKDPPGHIGAVLKLLQPVSHKVISKRDGDEQ